MKMKMKKKQLPTIVKKSASAVAVSKRGAPVAAYNVPDNDIEALKGAYIGENGQCIYIDMSDYIAFKAMRLKSPKSDPDALISLRTWGSHYARIARAEFTETDIWQAFMSPSDGRYLWNIDFLEENNVLAFNAIIEDIRSKYINK